MGVIAIALIGLTSLALFGFGANVLYLTLRSIRLQPRRISSVTRGTEPKVCVQVPIYNERYVAERILDAVCELDWPNDRFEVQVLDDPDDDTVSIIDCPVDYAENMKLTQRLKDLKSPL